MFNYHNFNEVFAFDPGCSYDDSTLQNIAHHHRELSGLFIEKVLKLLGIKRPVKYYPPKTNIDLRNLHKAVIESSGADHHKLSVLYYVLLDLDGPTGKRVYSEDFLDVSFLPLNYQIYMKGLFHLDRMEFEMALQYLTHPSLIPTFPDEILEVLVRNAKTDLTLPLAYYHTVQPALTSSQALESLFSVIARTSVTEGFYFSRGQPEYAQKHMFEILISLVLNNSPAATIADRSVELVNLPLTREEEAWLEEYLLNGEGRQIRRAKDTLMMRRLGTGKFGDSMAMKGMPSRTIGGLDWSVLLDGVEKGQGLRNV